MLLERDEELHAIVAGEAAHEAVTVLVDAGGEVGGYAEVEGAVAIRSEQVNKSKGMVLFSWFPLARE